MKTPGLMEMGLMEMGLMEMGLMKTLAMSPRWIAIGFAALLATSCLRGDVPPQTKAAAGTPEKVVSRKATLVTGHPRLWVTATDLPRLRSWAVDSNPLWKSGLQVVAARAKQEMDNNTVPGGDSGQVEAVDHPTEMYALLFAFMSLVHPQAAARDNYASRARTLLMYIIDRAANGASSGAAYRDPDFSIRDRSRWHGESFGLVVDWIYPKLSAADKTQIHKVFSRWVDENMNAGTTAHNHPEPVGLTNDPKLVADRVKVRWSANNYYTAHMRNLGLMGLALDPADDPDGKLKKGFASAVGAFLYVNDHLRRTDSKGGLSPEGPYYAPESVSYTTQLLLALSTAGADDIAAYGKQVAIASDPYWDDILAGWFHQYPPAPREPNDWEGPIWENAWTGDGATQSVRDPIALFGPLGIYHYKRGNTARLERVRWIQEHFPRGGKTRLLERVASGQPMLDTILYFMLYEPGYKSPADPRPSYPKTHLAEGVQQLYARDGWDDKASFFRFICGWLTIDHQHSDGNHFGFWRKGEWLTRDRTGYGQTNPHSQYHNTISIRNDSPNSGEGFIHSLWQSGSQWWGGMAAGDGKIARHASNARFVYALGDATPLYNSKDLGISAVTHATRSIIWLKPDHVVVYDRAETTKASLFKRLWQQLPSNATVNGTLTTAKTLGGQQLFIRTLLPKDAKLSVAPGGGAPVNESLMTHRLRVQGATGRAKERFLHVLQGADAGASADPVTLVEASEGGYVGATIQGVVALFPETVGAAPNTIRYSVPAGIQQHILTGLDPNGDYTVDVKDNGGTLDVTVTKGGSSKADRGGVLAHPPVDPSVDPDGGLPPLADGGVPPPKDGGGSAGDGGVAGDGGKGGEGRDANPDDDCTVAGGGSAGLFSLLFVLALRRRRREQSVD